MRGNKGEWSEIYTFLKLLGEGVLFCGDQNLNKMNSIFYPLISIIREEQNKYYYYNRDQKNVNVLTREGNLLFTLDSKRFKSMSDELRELPTT